MAKEYIDKGKFDTTLQMLGYDPKDLPRRALEQQPAADVAPVVHGYWIHIIGNSYACSECGIRETWGRLSKYCPNCGAKVGGGK